MKKMDNDSKEYEQMDELLILYLKGKATDQQRIEARSWINESPEHHKYFDALKEFYQIQDINYQPGKFNVTQGWNKVEAGYYKELYQREIINNDESGSIFLKIALPVAAAILLAFLTGFFVFKHLTTKYQLNTIAYNEINVPLGAKSQITLSDGTKVWLNAGSKFRYPVLFTKNKREVFLEGEAFFDVTHNPEKIFLVKTADITVKVFGTQFNVKSYPEENKVTTTLVQGSVAIQTSDKTPDTYLKPNQTATFYKANTAHREEEYKKSEVKSEEVSTKTTLVVAKEIDPQPVTSWKDNRWIIDSEELGQLAVVFERRYNVKISFADSSLKKYTFTGSLTNETFEQVLKIIQLSAPIQFDVENNLITIREDRLYKTNRITK